MIDDSSLGKPINLYLIPGMGTDHRVFNAYEFDRSLVNPICIKWIDHKPAKDLADYAESLVDQIDLTKPFVLLGVSMGGMIAMEISRRHQPLGVILISSAMSPAELPNKYQLGRFLPLYKGLTNPLLTFIAKQKHLYKDINKEAIKSLYMEMLRDAGADFLTWQIQSVIHWNLQKVDSHSFKLFRVHGSKDNVIPIKNVQTDIDLRIENGSHKLVVNYVSEICASVDVFIEEEIIFNFD